MAEVSADARASADVILPLVRRVAPGALEKAELIESAGMDPDEIREGLAVLLAEKAIVETDDGYATGQPAAPTAAKDAEAPKGDGESNEEAPEAPDPAAPTSVPGSGQSYRATLDVTVTYGGPPRDEAAMAMAAAMETEIADLIHGQYPESVVSVDVKKVEAYRPRVIFGTEPAED